MKAVCWPGPALPLTAFAGGPNYTVLRPVRSPLPRTGRANGVSHAAPDGVPWVRLCGDGKFWCMSPHNGWLGVVE